MDEETQLAILEVKEQLLEELAQLRQELLEQIKPKRSVRFYPPSLEEVQQFVKKKNLPVNAFKWWHFYAGKDWMIGKAKMRNWKKAIYTWVSDEPTSQPAHRPESEAAQRETRKLLDELPEKAHDPNSDLVSAYRKARLLSLEGDAHDD